MLRQVDGKGQVQFLHMACVDTVHAVVVAVRYVDPFLLLRVGNDLRGAFVEYTALIRPESLDIQFVH